MGTNYYKICPRSRQQKDILIKAIEEDRLKVEDEWGRCVFKDEDGDWIIPPKTEIHIGKHSGGWKFLFNHNDWEYFDKSKESLYNWIKDPSTGIIQDEYNKEISFEDFWKIAMNTYETPWIDGSERLDCKTYYEKYPDDIGAKYGLDSDFYVDGLRFSKHTSFC